MQNKGSDGWNMTDVKAIITKFKFPIMMLSLAVCVLLLPANSKDNTEMSETDYLLSEILSCTDGVGEARVIVSENGVVVVCSGAFDAGVRLEIMKAVSSYTGFGSDRITVLKMAKPK